MSEPRSGRNELEELFARVLAGELAASDGEVQRALASRPEWSERVREAEHLRQRLARAGEERRAVLREGLADVRASDREAARRFVEQSSGVAAARPRVLRPALSAAAAVLLVALGVLWWSRRPVVPPSPSGPLGGPTATAAPVGSVHAIDAFQLPGSLPTGGWATVLVLEREASGALRQVLAKERLETTRWELRPEERAALPRELTWIYEIHDAQGALVAQGSFEASRP